MMSEQKLRNCPFCGGTNLYITDSYQGSPFFYNVICKGCGIRWISLDKRFLNTRPIEDELQKHIAELEEQVWNLNLENERLEEAYWTDEFDTNSTKTQLMSVKEIAIKRCPNCPLVEEREE